MLKRLAAALGLVGKPDPGWYSSRCTDGQHGLELTYLGTGGFVLDGRGRTLVLDPYVTRTGLPRLLTGPLIPDESLVARLIPRADDVLVGHAHFDHVLDAPVLCKQTGARLVGSPAVSMVGRAAGLPERQMHVTSGREDIACGAFSVRGLPSRHGKVFMNRVLFPGDITSLPAWPPRIGELKHGLVLNWHVETEGFSMVHIDSADFIREELQGRRADLVCLCAAGRKARPNYVPEVIELLRPKWVMPCHWDTMVTPIDGTPDLLPGVDLPGMMQEIRAAGTDTLLMPLLGKLRF